MQNYYRVLGLSPMATAAQVEQAYLRQRTRLKRLATADRAMKIRLAEVEEGYAILANPRRRLAYDLLLSQEPATEREPRGTRAEEEYPGAARIARSLNAALLACCLFLALDWALPLREYANETVRSRIPFSIPAPLSDPQMAYRVYTAHTAFRLPSAIGYRVRAGQRVTVWETPLLRVVRRVRAPGSPDGSAPFQPYGGSIYGTFALLPLLIGLVSGIGLRPGTTAETVVNTAVVSGILAVLAVAVLLLL